MLLKTETEYSDGTIQTCFETRKCRYCGKTFIKLQNKTLYCSTDCKHKTTQDNKAAYQRKRRKLIRSGEVISNETRKIGTTYFPKTPITDFQKEYDLIQNAKRKIGIL